MVCHVVVVGRVAMPGCPGLPRGTADTHRDEETACEFHHCDPCELMSDAAGRNFRMNNTLGESLRMTILWRSHTPPLASSSCNICAVFWDGELERCAVVSGRTPKEVMEGGDSAQNARGSKNQDN